MPLPKTLDLHDSAVRPDPHSTLQRYKNALRESIAHGEGNLRGTWCFTDCSSPTDLLAAITSAETSPDSVVLKEDRRTRVTKAHLFNHDVVIKSYTLTRPAEHLKYLLRVSPARRFWATATVMQQLNIPTPRPLACLQQCRGPVPVRSYVINAFAPDTITARQWIEPAFHTLAPEEKTHIMQQMLNHLLLLYRHGIYHKDTKCENILLQHPLLPDRQRLLWIDLECCLCKQPSRHDITRNLVQLNGAIGLQVSREDRLTFLDLVAEHYPWANTPDVIDRICAWTARRLDKEKAIARQEV
jgi:hypothetical protein